MRFLLVHSPVVGPTTWRWVAEALTSVGHEVAVPDLRAAAVIGQPPTLVAAAVTAVPASWSSAAVVGHSGAGFFLPSIAEGLGSQAGKTVFVDAGLPPCEGRATASADFGDRLRELAVDDVLPRWSTWWGEGAMEMLVPDPARRAAVEAEMPEVPLALYELPVEVPAGWCESAGSFLLLSEPYRSEAQRARALGWATVERLGNHLDIVNDAGSIARSLIELAEVTP